VTFASGVVAPCKPDCTVGGTLPGFSWSTSFTSSVAVAFWPMYDALMSTTPPSDPFAVKVPVESIDPIGGWSEPQVTPEDTVAVEPFVYATLSV
jgi:hypothetical protein